MKKTHTAVIFIDRSLFDSAPLTEEEVSGFCTGWHSCARWSGGNAGAATYFILPNDEAELKSRALDLDSGLKQEAVDEAFAAHQKNLDALKIAWDAPCDGTCGGTEFGDCNHDRHPRP